MINSIPTRSRKIMRSFSAALLLGLTILSSCGKDDTPVQQFGYLRFINVSPTFATYNIFNNSTAMNTVPIPFGGTISYKEFPVGEYNITYRIPNDLQDIVSKKVNLTFANRTGNSLYLIDKGTQMEAFLVVDDMTVESKTKGYIKFINLSPDAPALDLDIEGGANLVKGKAYKTGSTYMEIDPKTYAFALKDATTGAVKTTLTDIEIVAGRYYTIISRGLLNPGPNDRGFSAQSIINQ